MDFKTLPVRGFINSISIVHTNSLCKVIYDNLIRWNNRNIGQFEAISYGFANGVVRIIEAEINSRFPEDTFFDALRALDPNSYPSHTTDEDLSGMFKKELFVLIKWLCRPQSKKGVISDPYYKQRDIEIEFAGVKKKLRDFVSPKV